MMYIIANCAMPSQQLIFLDVLTKNEEFNMTVDMQTSLASFVVRLNTDKKTWINSNKIGTCSVVLEFIWGIITLYCMNLLICGLQNDFDNLCFYVIEYQNVSLMD